MTISSILVTGSSGTVGTALVETLLNKGYDVTGVDIRPNPWSERINDLTIVNDLGNNKAINELPASVDMVVHLAANARVHRLVQTPELAKENFDMTFNILEYTREIGADLIFSSSREVYGNNGKIVHDETDTYVDECESPYTASKIGGEALVKSYDNCYDMKTSILRFSNVYGKYDGSDRVVPLFIAQSQRGEDLTVYGDHKVLDFTYLTDCIDGIVRVIEQFNKASGTTFNIASGRGTSLLQLAELIVDKTDSDISIQVESNRTGEVSRFIADISKAKKMIGYEPSYTMEKGLEATIDWYLSNTDILDEILSE